MRSNHIRKITIAVSILLHLIFLASYKDLRHLLVLSPNESLADQEVEKQIVFEIDEPREVIETPDDAIQNAPTERTNLVSDKNSIARDRNTNPDLAVGAPYQRGDIANAHNIHEARSQEFQQEMSPDQQEQKREVKKEQQEQQREDQYALDQLNPQEFSRQALLGRQAQQQRREQKQAMYNNEDFSAFPYLAETKNYYRS